MEAQVGGQVGVAGNGTLVTWLGSEFMLRTLASCWNKENLHVMRGLVVVLAQWQSTGCTSQVYTGGSTSSAKF